MDDVRDAHRAQRLEPGLAALTDDELTTGYARILADSRRSEWARLALEAEIDARQMWRQDGVTSLQSWIAMWTGEGDRASRHHARVARTLADYPQLSEALGDGQMSFAHLLALLTLAALTGLGDTDLLELGRRHSVTQLESACRAARRLDRVDDDDAHARRSLRWSFDDKGTMRLTGTLYGTDALTVSSMLTAMAKAAAPTDDGSDDLLPFDVRTADALVDLCAPPTGSPACRPTVIIHTPVDNVVDPTCDTADSAGSGDCCGPTSSSPANGPQGDRPPAAAGSHAKTRRARYSAATTWDGTPISDAALQRLLCDARTRTVLEDRSGKAVGIGRLTRTTPHWLAEQVRWRDGQCRFPGCEHTRWTHIHHQWFWGKGGPTDLDNLVLLCNRHHRLLHEGQWDLSGCPDGALVFTNPNGRRFIARPALHPHTLPPTRRRGRRATVARLRRSPRTRSTPDGGP